MNLCWFLYNGFFFTAIKPILFVNRLDITANVMMLTNLQNALIENKFVRWLFDIIYISTPLILVFFTIKDFRGRISLAFFTSFFCMTYGIFFSKISFISSEGFVSWVFVSLIFTARNQKDFFYKMHTVRLVFIIIFSSAALWKIRTGALFNVEQMSGILLKQHNAYLSGVNSDWYTVLVSFLINHKITSYSLYLLSTVGELTFIVGIFTRKFDKYLIAVFLCFVFFDYFFMAINYVGWTVFMGCFYFSKYPLEGSNKFINERFAY